MAGVVGTSRAGDADDRSLECLVSVTSAFDKGLAQKQRKTAVPVLGQAFFETGRWLLGVHIEIEKRNGRIFNQTPTMWLCWALNLPQIGDF